MIFVKGELSFTTTFSKVENKLFNQNRNPAKRGINHVFIYPQDLIVNCIIRGKIIIT